MIKSFRCRETQKIFREERSRRFANIERVALRKLLMLNAAEQLSDLAGVSNSLEALTGDRKGQHAIRINDQFRLCFIWSERDAIEVEIVDYH